MRARAVLVLVALVLVALVGGCGGQAPTGTIQAATNISLTSPDFPVDPGPLPRDLGCGGAGRAPSMTWSDPPPTTRSLVVEMVDTEAPGGVFAHWLVYDIPAGARSLMPPLSAQAAQGRNGFGSTGYRGPCPPPGQTHVYLLLVYATEVEPNLPSGLTRSQLESRFRDHVIGMGQLEGTYRR